VLIIFFISSVLCFIVWALSHAIKALYFSIQFIKQALRWII